MFGGHSIDTQERHDTLWTEELVSKAPAQKCEVALTSKVLGHKLAFVPYRAFHHLSWQASSRQRPIARDRRGSLLGHS
jgi:hypothetical protein